MSTLQNGLAPMPEDWARALAVVAHPDDLEYGTAAAIARWTDAGAMVAYLLASRGEAGIDTIPPEQAGPQREAEEIASAAIVGVQTVEFLGHRDGIIEYGIPLRRDIAARIRRHRPELVITLNHHDHWAGGVGRNTPDHRNVGAAVLDAVGDAGNRWIFPEQLVDGLEPWEGVRWIAVASSPVAGHGVDVTETFDRGLASLRAHQTYLAALGGEMAEPEGFLRSMAADAGRQLGVPLAVGFELIAVR